MVGVCVVGCITTLFAALEILAGLLPGPGVNSHLLEPAIDGRYLRSLGTV